MLAKYRPPFLVMQLKSRPFAFAFLFLRYEKVLGDQSESRAGRGSSGVRVTFGGLAKCVDRGETLVYV